MYLRPIAWHRHHSGSKSIPGTLTKGGPPLPANYPKAHRIVFSPWASSLTRPDHGMVRRVTNSRAAKSSPLRVGDIMYSSARSVSSVTYGQSWSRGTSVLRRSPIKVAGCDASSSKDSERVGLKVFGIRLTSFYVARASPSTRKCHLLI